MTFQQHTTYEQSLKLKELGMEQSIMGKCYIVSEAPCRNLSLFDHSGSMTLGCARAFTRQELEDYLMERHELIVMSWKDGDSTAYLDPQVSNGCIEDSLAFAHGETRFDAVLKATMWMLEQERNQKTDD